GGDPSLTGAGRRHTASPSYGVAAPTTDAWPEQVQHARRAAVARRVEHGSQVDDALVEEALREAAGVHGDCPDAGLQCDAEGFLDGPRGQAVDLDRWERGVPGEVHPDECGVRL